VVAEDVGKLPDNNVIEALQRVTGIQVTNRTGGEASAISIRGLTDALTTLNGRNIFTSDGQSFALQDLSSNLIRQVDVYKTRAADQLETGLAGQIDVQTRRPFDFKDFAFSAQVRGIYNQQANSYNPNVSALISKRWTTDIGDIGVLVNGSYSRTKYRDMAVTAGAFVPFATQNPPAGSGLTPLAYLPRRRQSELAAGPGCGPVHHAGRDHFEQWRRHALLPVARRHLLDRPLWQA
jgi:TonB-dependent receptor